MAASGWLNPKGTAACHQTSMGQCRRSKSFSCFKHILYKDVGAVVQFYFGGAKVSTALNTSDTKLLAQ